MTIGELRTLVSLALFAIVAAHLVVLPGLFRSHRQSAFVFLLISSAGLLGICGVLFLYPQWFFRAVLAYALLFSGCGFWVAGKTARPCGTVFRFSIASFGMLLVPVLAYAGSKMVS
ncbi:hypothetical protein [Luteimonas huabeiensis]|uniref:hypothetical protein n=1 Tax=Luteimonas huabeiensis TaxID=1244513 RepID=UPI000466DB69|nr:hypothetical protein [Luteimonas huabeiensis]